MDYQDSDTMTEAKTLNGPKNRKLSIESLMGEIKPVLKMNYEFEYGDESKLIFFWNFRIIRIPIQGKKPTNFP